MLRPGFKNKERGGGFGGGRGQLTSCKQLLAIPHDFKFLLPERRSKKMKRMHSQPAKTHLPLLSTKKMKSNRYPLKLGFTTGGKKS